MGRSAKEVILVYLSLLVLSVLFTYGLSVGLNHVNAFVPFLGYLGDQPVESTVFTQLFVIVSVAYFFVIHVQYVWLTAILDDSSQRINTVSVCFGYLGAAALFVLACFQESNAFYVHHVAEYLYLLSSQVYFLLQTIICKKLNDPNTRAKVCLNVFMIVFFLTFVTCYVIAVTKFDKDWEERFKWKKGDKGWVPYILSAISQWVLITLFQIYLLTFYVNFKSVSLTKTSIVVLNRNR